MTQKGTTNSISRSELINSLGQLVGFNTVNKPEENIKMSINCPKFIVDYLAKKGIKAEIFENEGYYSVFGKIGEGNYHLLLMAHFDVVPTGDNWKSNPFKMELKDNKIAFGRGVVDNKNNVASIMAILPEIKKLNLGKDLTVCFDLTGDEEISGVYGAGKYREKFDRMPDAVINLDGHDEVIISRRRNAMGATIIIPKKKGKIVGEIKGKTFTTAQYGRHTAYQNPGGDIHCLLKASVEAANNNWKVVGCSGKFLKGNVVPDECTLSIIEEKGNGVKCTYDENLTVLIHNLRYLIRTLFPSAFSIYGITIGPNLLFDKESNWELGLDIRAMTQQYDEVEKALRKMCDELLGVKNYELIFKPGQGMVNTPVDSLLITTAIEAAKECGIPPKIVEMGGASDARYFSREGIPTFDFGPFGGEVHASNEWLDLASFERVTNFYLEVVKRIHLKIKKH